MSPQRVAAMIAAIIFTIITLGVYFFTWQGARTDVDAYINRAQVAANRDDMVDYIDLAMTGMEEQGMTSGHTAVFFKRADNDLALTYKTLSRTKERLESINEIPESDTAYQVALDDIRGTLREVENPANGKAWAEAYWWGVIAIICWLLYAVAWYFE